jgi:exo-1,4-beta-D-glucosaminidase
LRLTGGAWIPDFLMGWDAQRYRDEIRLMAEGNHTVVRVNGCGIIPPDVFFDACDRLGVMAWEDFARTSIESCYSYNGRKWGYPADCDEPALWLANMRDCVLRLRGHPSLLVWCGSNEDPPPKYLGVAMQDQILPELDGTRPWLPSSSAEPEWAKEPMHVWSGGPWQMIRLPDYFKLYARDEHFTARDEIGIASIPPMNSSARFLPDYNQPDPATPPFNRTMSYHDATDDKMRATDKIIREDLGEPACLSDYLSMGDLYNDLAYRAIFEAANKVRPRNAGTHLWKVNAAWPSFLWQVFDWYLRPNAGYYSMKSACRPLHVQHSADDHSLQLVSTLPEARSNLTLRITAADTSGRIEHREERTVSVPADATVSLGDLPLLKQDEKLRFLVLELLDAKGRELDRTATFVQRDCRYHELLALPPAAVAARVSKRFQEGDETVIQLTVQNTSGIPAVNVWLEVLRGPQGEEVLPSFWNENALLLLASEQRHLTVRLRTKDLHDKPPHLMVEGWNVLPAETDIATGENAPLQLKVTHSEVVGDSGAVCVKFSGSQAGSTGARWTTWPVPIKVDDHVVRYVRLAVKSGSPLDAQITLTNLLAGTHRVAVGDSPDHTITIPVTSSARGNR